MSNNPSAGSAEPHWFEWETGLLWLVDLLDEDSEISAVAFQIHGVKGWDDVGIRLKSGVTRLMQMKHSRAENNLTFGGLVAVDTESKISLIGTLAQAWKKEKQNRGDVECVLVTNRAPGPNWHLESPPLSDFWEKIKMRISHAPSVEDVAWKPLVAAQTIVNYSPLGLFPGMRKVLPGPLVIDYDLSVEINICERKARITGSHDGYPSYTVRFGKTGVVYDHQQSGSLLDLQPPMEIRVNKEFSF